MARSTVISLESRKLGDTAKLYGRFITRLKALGCVRCPSCGDYVYPEHLSHACAGSLTVTADRRLAA